MKSDEDFSEWLLNQHRDSIASYIGHHHFVEYLAIAENAAVGRVKHELLEVQSLESNSELSMQKMYRPCGPPPPTDEELLGNTETLEIDD